MMKKMQFLLFKKKKQKSIYTTLKNIIKIDCKLNWYINLVIFYALICHQHDKYVRRRTSIGVLDVAYAQKG